MKYLGMSDISDLRSSRMKKEIMMRHPEPVSVFCEPKSKGISKHGIEYASTPFVALLLTLLSMTK